MTIAIGTKFMYGPIKGGMVCADSRVTATDGATCFGVKTHLSITPRQSAFAIADSGEDANVAKMLASDITCALCEDSVDSIQKVIATTKATMTEWYSAYSGSKPPSVEFVLAAGVKGQYELLYCASPNTVFARANAFAIGAGSRAVDPLLSRLDMLGIPSAEEAILRAGYWMYRAKRDEGAYCGGETHMFMVSQWGKMSILGDQMAQIEELGSKIDDLLHVCRYGLLNHSTDAGRDAFLEDFRISYVELAAMAKAISMPTLRWLEGQTWETKPKHLTSRKSKSEGR